MTTVQDYITALREDILDDADGEVLWSNTQLVRLLNRTLREIGLRREQFYDDTGDFNLSVIGGQAQYTYDQRVFTLESLVLASNQRELAKATYRWLECQQKWRDQTGLPTHYVENPTEQTVRLWPSPTVADTVYVKCYRLPAYAYTAIGTGLEATVSEPSSDIYFDAILYGMAMYAFQRRDSDSHDGKASQYYSQLFTQAVGPPISARDLLARKENANLNVSVLPHPYAPRIKRRKSFYERSTTDFD